MCVCVCVCVCVESRLDQRTSLHLKSWLPFNLHVHTLIVPLLSSPLPLYRLLQVTELMKQIERDAMKAMQKDVQQDPHAAAQ